jgi:hypothetical protein
VSLAWQNSLKLWAVSGSPGLCSLEILFDELDFLGTIQTNLMPANLYADRLGDSTGSLKLKDA